MSMKASVRSSSSIRVAGRSPAAILQKMQSASAMARETNEYLPGPRMAGPTTTEQALEAVVRRLTAFDRESASPGEREASEWLAGELRAAGLEPVLEEEPAVGGFWLPL